MIAAGPATMIFLVFLVLLGVLGYGMWTATEDDSWDDWGDGV